MNIVRFFGICMATALLMGSAVAEDGSDWSTETCQDKHEADKTVYSTPPNIPPSNAITQTNLILGDFNASTTLANNDALVDYLQKLGVKNVIKNLPRGSEEPVLFTREDKVVQELSVKEVLNSDLGNVIEVLDALEIAEYEVGDDKIKMPGGMGRAYASMLKRISKFLVKKGNQYNGDVKVDIRLSGQIDCFYFEYNKGTAENPTEGEPSDPNQGAFPKYGTLWIDSTTEITATPILATGAILGPVSYKFKYYIRTKPGTVAVHKKNEVSESSKNADYNPFPGTIEFSEDMKERIESYKFKFKIYVGPDPEDKELSENSQTDKIEVYKVDFTNRKGKKRTWTKGSEMPDWAKPIFEREKYDCIDMLFVSAPRQPEKLDGLSPPLYCLGRCAKPMLINTGL